MNVKRFVVMLGFFFWILCPALWAYEIVSVERHVDSSDPDVVVTERFPTISGLADPVMAGTVNELLRYLYDQFYIEKEEERGKRSLWVDYEISLETTRFLSLKIKASEYIREAAHPLNYLEAITLDLEQGCVLALSDLFLPESNYRQRVNAYVQQQLSRRDAEGEPVIPLITSFQGIEPQNCFYLTSIGVVVFFPEYKYTPHSWGPLEVEIPYALLQDIMVAVPEDMGVTP